MRLLQWFVLGFAVLNMGCVSEDRELFVHRAKAANTLAALRGVALMGQTWLGSAPMDDETPMDEIPDPLPAVNYVPAMLNAIHDWQ
jgi:hypothetical protein